MIKTYKLLLIFLLMSFQSVLQAQTADRYGYDPKYPIKVGGGPANQRKYLDLLTDGQGEKITYIRLSSCCPYISPNSPIGMALCDKYEIKFKNSKGKKKKAILYLSFYDYETPVAPGGFKLEVEDIDKILRPELFMPNSDKEDIKKLKLASKGLTTIPDYVFELKNLESLNLSYNQIIKLPDRISELTNLKILNLMENQLFQLPSNIASLKYLEEIYLNKGMYWEDTFEKLSKLPSLKRIYLSGVDLEYIPNVIRNCPKLEEIRLSDNPKLNLIKTFEVLSNVSTLKILYIGSSDIIEIPSNISTLKKLEELYIGSTSITTLPVNIGDLENLKVLILYGNSDLESLPASISKLYSLKEINLGAMGTDFNWSLSFQRLSYCLNLKKLILRSNYNLEIVPKEIGDLASLEYLDMSVYSMTEIPKEIGKLVNLKYLNIATSAIESIPDEIVQLKNLETIDISGRVGFSFEREFEKFSQLPKLSKLIINWGEQRIPNSIKKFKALTILQIENYEMKYITKKEIERIKQLIPYCGIIY